MLARMAPAVPFALLGVVELLAVAGWLALAAAALSRAGRRPGAAPLLVAAGALVLSGVEVRTAAASGSAASDVLPLVRAAGALLLGGGLGLGALRRPAPARRPDAGLAVVALPGVVAPLSSGLAPALLATTAGVLAAGAALRARRDGPGRLVAGGLLAAAAASAVGPLADTSRGALLELLLRGTGAALVLTGLALVGRRSLLSKVVAAILAGVLLTAAAAVGVVGTVLVGAYDAQARLLVEVAAQDRAAQLAAQPARLELATRLLQVGCGGDEPARCRGVVALLPAVAQDAVVRLPRAGAPRQVAGRGQLSPTELLGLGTEPVVTAAQTGPGTDRTPGIGSALVRLAGEPPQLAAVAAVPVADGALAYVVRLDGDYLAAGAGTAEYAVSLLGGGRVLATSDPDQAAAVLAAAQQAGVGDRLSAPRTVAAQGAEPTVSFRPLPGVAGPVAVLAVARNAGAALTAQRSALTALLLAVLVAATASCALAVALGRRTVAPVRRLTAAARRVAAGDLDVVTAERTRDEVGVLSRTFDGMTGSLVRLTDDLRASAVRLSAVLTAMGDGLLATGPDGLVTTANPAALALVGLDEPQVLGATLGEVVRLQLPGGEGAAPGPDVDLDDPDLRLRDVDAALVVAGRRPLPVRVDLLPLADGLGHVLVLRDTSREREVERMKTEFLSNVSHELRTPLTPIRGYADLLASRPGLTPQQVSTFAGTILSESLKMNRVVDLLVDVAALEAGRVQVEPREVAPAALLEPRLERWRTRVPERARDLSVRLAPGLPDVLVDPEWLGKALDELVDNALKHTPPGTSVVLGAAAGRRGRVRISVADTGPGIAEADQRVLLTSFEQVDGSATRRVGGLGLGLSFVSRIASDAGFPLEVDSAPGEGATFSLSVPAAAPVRRRRLVRR